MQDLLVLLSFVLCILIKSYRYIYGANINHKTIHFNWGFRTYIAAKIIEKTRINMTYTSKYHKSKIEIKTKFPSHANLYAHER
jgi:hypothetical protein